MANANKNIIGYILREEASEPMEVKLSKTTENPRRVVAEGKLQRAEEKNRNGRIYPKAELFPQITCPRTKELIAAGYMRAEAGHPLDKDLARQQTIDPTKVCAIFQKLWTNGDYVMGRFIGTNNDLGAAFDQDLRDGYKPAWSLRALGSIETTKRGAEVHNMKLITYDHVIYPSHPGAYTTKIVSESGSMTTADVEQTRLMKLVEAMDAQTAALKEEYDGTKANIHVITNEGVINFIKQESASFKMIKESFDVLYDTITLAENGRSIQLMDKTGSVIMMPLENYVQRQIMNYCGKDMRW